MKLAWLRRVCQVNQQSTSVHIKCGECGRLVSNSVSCYCSKCKSLQSSKCSVCNRVVKGVYAWCQGCSHGGHLMHMKEWFSNHSKCPRCGHLCEYEWNIPKIRIYHQLQRKQTIHLDFGLCLDTEHNRINFKYLNFYMWTPFLLYKLMW